MQIVFNGKTFNSLEEMPANERAAYEQMQKIFVDADGNGIPDFLEGDIAKNVMTAFTTNVVNYDGKVYNSLDELPADARQKVQDALAKLNQLGIVSGTPSAQKQLFDFAFQPSKPLLQQEATGNGTGRALLIIVAIAVALVVCGAGAAFFLFAR